MSRLNANTINGLTLIAILASVPRAAAAGDPPRHPAALSPDEKDWAQPGSGEWVGGSIDLMRDLDMQFDGDKRPAWDDLVGDILELTTSLTWDRVETPQPSADGVVPRRDDVRFALGLGVDM